MRKTVDFDRVVIIASV